MCILFKLFNCPKNSYPFSHIIFRITFRSGRSADSFEISFGAWNNLFTPLRTIRHLLCIALLNKKTTMLLVVFVNSISFRSRDYSISGRNSSRADPLSHLPTGLNLTIPSFANSNAILNADAATQVVSKYLHYHLEKYEAFYLESRRKLIVVICTNPAENPCYSGVEVLYVVESSGLRGPF